MSFEWQNLDEFLRKLGEAVQQYEDGCRQGVTEFTAEVQGEAALNAPIDEGALRASGSFYVDAKYKGDTSGQAGGPLVLGASQGTPNRTGGPEVAKRPGWIRAVIGFNTPYAAVQHERPFRHPKGGEQKYLEKAMRRKKESFPKILRRVLELRGF